MRLLVIALLLAAPAAAVNADETIAISSISPARPSLGNRVIATLKPEDLKRLKGDGSKPLVLQLDGRAMTGIAVLDGPNDTLVFDLARTSENQAAWAPILGLSKSRDVLVRIQGPSESTAPSKVTFDFFARTPAIVAASILGVLVLLALFIAGVGSTMLRDPGTSRSPAIDTVARWRQFGTFSLGRVQMAFWFFLVITSFLVIWAVTGDTPPLTASVLALIGIGSGTALGAAMIDDSKRTLNAALLAHKTRLDAQAAAETDPAKKAELAAQAAAAQAKMDQPAGPSDSVNLFNDILTDATGWSFHRLQLVAWTAVLGLMFCASVVHHLVMPDFDATLLALVGISSGTYLGFKLPEKQS